MQTPRVRPTFAAVLGVLSLGLAACGDDALEPAAPVPDSTVPSATDPTPPTTSGEPADEPADDAISHPEAPDEVVVRIASEGGFMPIEAFFTQLPTLLVSGDGRAFTQGPQIAIYPGPLLPNVLVADIGEAGIQRLLERAAEHGLLAEREYESPTNVADAPDTVVTIHAGGETYEHRAYALGLGGGPAGGAETGARADLQAFVDESTGALIETSEPAGEPFTPDRFLIRATPFDPDGQYDIEPTFIDWPEGADVDLAAAGDCVEVAATAVLDLFADAHQLTFFEQGDETYQVLVKPKLPGMSC
ncbi:MAG: hypothetical protein HKN41_04820 [Ilumatobacter sp.]|nr:hypothetical protein [Ilumatobacter sp.]